ncbi:MAG: hypothetical protein AB7F94_09105 [Nitrospira sp.]
MKHVKSIATSVVIAGVLGAAANVVAQTVQPGPAPKPGQHEAPAGKGEMQGMHGMVGMMNMMGQMDAAQMKQMMENCNKMMEGGMFPPQAPGAEPKKG